MPPVHQEDAFSGFIQSALFFFNLVKKEKEKREKIFLVLVMSITPTIKYDLYERHQKTRCYTTDSAAHLLMSSP